MKTLLPIFVLAALVPVVPAQEAKPPLPAQPSETLVVVGTAQPVPLGESTATVTVEAVEPALLAVGSAQDLLRRDASVVLMSRGAGGGQADLSIRGGSFGQALVLVNGFRGNDGQTGHHNLDLPVPLEAMQAVEVLHGTGSTLHGEDALSGVVDFLTVAPASTALRLRTGYGSFDSLESSLRAEVTRKQWSLRATGEQSQSDGFKADRDYRNESGAVEGWIGSRLGVTNVLLAGSDRAFGADQFYGAYASWERTKSWLATVRQDLGASTQAAFGYRRHTDDFVLLRSNPAKYENRHETGAWQASLRRRAVVKGPSAVLLLGVEGSGDSIRSLHEAVGVTTSALGQHTRNRGAGYVDLDLRPARRRWSLSAGARETVFSGGRTVFSPQAAGSYRLSNGLKARASVGYGFRIPTYTDLYYADPATQGDPNLKPESAWSVEGGVDWTPGRTVKVQATGFLTRQKNMIDYARGSASEPWKATNLEGVRYSGAEASAEWKPSEAQSLRLSWTGVAGQRQELNGLQSRYALNYATENATAVWTATVKRQIAVMNSVRVTQIYQQPGQAKWNDTPYAVWNAAVTREAGRFRPYLRLENLGNNGYQEIGGVAIPGRTITGGLVVALSRR